MKNLKIISITKDQASIGPSGDFQLRINFEIMGTDGSDESKVLFAGQYRPEGSLEEIPGIPIYSDPINLSLEEDSWAIIPGGNQLIPKGAEVTIWGMVDTDFKPCARY